MALYASSSGNARPPLPGNPVAQKSSSADDRAHLQQTMLAQPALAARGTHVGPPSPAWYPEQRNSADTFSTTKNSAPQTAQVLGRGPVMMVRPPALNQSPASVSSDFATRKRELLSQKKLFEDPDFKPTSKSLYFKKSVPMSVVWKRPWELVKNPQFIKDGATRFDLDQGQLGDCWFIAAAATLAVSHQKIFERVVPPDQTFEEKDYAGMFCFNFWQNGQWQEVFVDDRLPTTWGTQLMYASNRTDPSEFWSALLEKAYAKLNGCYEAIDGGNIQDALVDMTGGVSEEISLANKSAIPPNLFDTILKTAAMNSLMGCAIPTAELDREENLSNGLYRGHAYSITAVVKDIIKGRETKLLRLRNPWGRSEWNGRWSDGSKEWTQLTPAEKEKYSLIFENDGEFWMTYEDMVANFTQLSFCHLVPDALTDEVAGSMNRVQWESSVMHGDWVRGITAGGCGNPPDESKYWINPQFRIDVKRVATGDAKPVPVIVALLEKEDRMRPDPVAIGFDIWKVRDPSSSGRLGNGNFGQQSLSLQRRTDMYSHNREVTQRVALEPGTYVLIASTFALNQEAKFLIRIYTETAAIAETTSVEQPTRLPATPASTRSPVDDLFQKYAGDDSVIDASELQALLNEHFKADLLPNESFSLDCARSLLSLEDRDQSGVLELAEVRSTLRELNSWKDAFKRFDKDRSGSVDTSELTALFQTIGFSVGRKALTSMVRRYGGKRGQMALSDFLVCLCKLTVMYSSFQLNKKATSQVAEISLEDWLAITLLY